MILSENAKCSICKNNRQFLIPVFDRNDDSKRISESGYKHFAAKPICPMCFSMLNKTAMMYTEPEPEKEEPKAKQ